MTSFNKWVESLTSKGLSKVIWICGSELPLIEVALDLIRATSISMPHNRSYLEADSDLWMKVTSRPLSHDDPRLFIIRNAESIMNWSPLMSMLDDKSYGDYCIVLVSSSNDIDRYPRAKGSSLGELKPYLKKIQAKGDILKCSSLTRLDIDTVLSIYGLPASMRSVIEDSAISSKSLKDLVTKLRILEAKSITNKSLQALCSTKNSNFIRSLLFETKKNAISCIPSISNDEVLSIVYDLDKSLGWAYKANKLVKANISFTDAVNRHNIPYIVKPYYSIAKKYDKVKVARCRQILALCEDLAGSGVQEAILETLVALW